MPLMRLNQYVLRASASPCEPSYAAAGNLLADGAWSYAYDAENRLVSATSAALTNGAIRVLNTYDHRHRRVRKTVQRLHSTMSPPPSPPTGTQEWQTVETRTFVYDDWNLAHETISAIDGGATNITEMQYLRGLDLSGALQGAGGVGGLLAVSISNSNFSVSQHYFPTYDVNGNITHYCDVQGNVVASYTYDAFGNTIAKSGALADTFSFRFSTKYFDTETGLYYYGYRFYSPELMRWLNRDPIEEQGGVNLYVFCGNRPIDKYDPTGLADCCIDGNRIRDKAIYSGVSIWRQYDRSVFGKNGLLSHAWIETDDGNSFGFYPHGRFETSSGSPKPFDEIPSSVVSPDPYAGKSKDSTFREERINLSPCRYDFGKIKRCIRAHSQMTPEPYVLFSHNCADWAKETVSFCIKYGERK